MNTMWWIATVILALVILLVWAYIWLKENLPLIAEKDDFVTTVKKGRIKAVRLGQRIVGYIGNISDEKKKVDQKTGKITDLASGETNYLDSLWDWKEFGVVILWWGKSVFKYLFEKDGQMIEATSIFLYNQLVYTIKDVEADGAVRLDITVQVVLETKHAGLSLNVPNWVAMVKNQIDSVIRAYVANMDAKEVMKEKVEDGSPLFQHVIDINNNVGNKSLEEIVGQYIRGFSVPSMDYAKDYKDAMEMKQRAGEKKEADLQEVDKKCEEKRRLAKAEKEASNDLAAAIENVGNAENKVLEKTTSIVGKKGASKIAQAKLDKEGVIGFKGTVLCKGGNSPGIVVNTKP
ncbi:MAG: SPFH domain-containing protein [Candidatus Paceibacterota bacterium]|jgi:regulator of protease activity HflC (stomatin/prohibitin superfamily)